MTHRSVLLHSWLALFTCALGTVACGDALTPGPATPEGGLDVAVDGQTLDSLAPDGIGDGAPVDTAPANTAPTITVVLPTDGTTITLGDAVLVEVKLADAEDKATDLSVTCHVQGFPNAIYDGKGTAEAKATFSAQGLPPGKQTLTCTVKDSGGLTASATVSVYVNTAPGAPTLEITPAKPTTLDELTAKVTTDSIDADRKPSELTYEFMWLKDGKATAYSGATLAAGIAKKGETWTVQATAKDPFTTGVPGQAQVTIQDVAPGAATLAIDPTQVDLMTEVTCNLASAASDADGDVLTYAYTWNVNGKASPGATTAALSVATLKREDGTAVHKGDKLSCSATASDGTLAGAAATSPEVEVAGYDVCASSLNPCDGNAGCTGSETLAVQCACKPGFSDDPSAGSGQAGTVCADVDECSDGSAGCDLAADCTNSAGSFACACKPGYGGDGKVCADVDECTSGTATCDLNAECSNTVGDYQCACKGGFSGDGKACSDVDECAAGTAVCDLNAECSNTVGTYQCACKAGYSGDGKACVDVDECALGTAACDLAASCSNTVGAYVCACKAGYSGDGKSCADVNECSLGTAACDLAATCSNTAGAYECACKPGYQGDGKSCSETDECKVGVAGQALVVPVDLAGWDVTGTSATVKWQAINGILYYGDPATKNYATGTSGNSGYAIMPAITIPNLPGIALSFDVTLDVESGSSYDKFTVEIASGATPTALFTKTSPVGKQIQHIVVPMAAYVGKTVTIKFKFNTVDDYKNNASGIGLGNLVLGGPAVCGANTACTNTPGAWTCACAQGFAGDVTACTDVDECAAGTAGCDANAACANKPGSFTCTCKTYYAGDGKTCADIDECKTNNGGCGAASAYTCTNKVGTAPTCTDIDECVAGTAGCSAQADCANTVGSFTCACKAGYWGDGKICTDFNECNGLPAAVATDFGTPGALSTWTVVNGSTQGTVGWQVATGILVFSNPTFTGYKATAQVKGTITTPNFTVAPKGLLKFEIFDETGDFKYSTYDDVAISVITATATTKVWNANAKLASGDKAKFVPVAIDLNAYAGQSIAVSFTFDSKDGAANSGKGIGIQKLSWDSPVGAACDANAVCSNSPGSYTCACKPGYTGDGKTCAGPG